MGFEPSEVDLARVPWHSEVSFAARLHNRSHEARRIELVKPSCGCTLIDDQQFTGMELSPGREIQIAGTLKVGNALGEHRRQIDVLLDNGAIHSLFLAYNAYPTYVITPSEIDLGVVDLDEREDSTVSIAFSSEYSAISAVPDADAAWVQTALVQRTPTESEILVRVRREFLPYGETHAQVHITTNDPYKPHAVVPLRLQTKARLRASPSRLVLARGESGTVGLIRADGSFAYIELWTPDDALLFERGTDGRALRIRVSERESFPTNLIELRDADGNRAVVEIVVIPSAGVGAGQ